jgi:SAM-dependent methyltransferase
MHIDSVHDYRAPGSRQPLVLATIDRARGDQVIEGLLRDESTGVVYPIRNSIPRFVGCDNYAQSFGLQWNRYRRVQLDSVNGSSLSRERLFQGTGWEPADLRGRRVLEAGCGAGRFAEVLLACGAELYSFDYSAAVDAAWANLGGAARWRLCQADIFACPFPEEWFDYVLCYGVLQHTPDPHGAFRQLVGAVKPGGQIAVDVYRQPSGLNKLAVKYWYRPLTRRLPSGVLLRIFETYLPYWIHVDRCLLKIPLLGGPLASLVPCWNKWGLPLDRRHRVEWTILDTFDAFSPEYDLAQTEQTVHSWFAEAGLADVRIQEGGNGIEGTARKAA